MKKITGVMVLVMLAACGGKETATESAPVATESAATAAETTATQASGPVAAVAGADGTQEVTIDTAGEFSPAVIQIKAGQPARLHFKRGSGASCAEEVVFTELGLRKSLPENQVTTVELPPQQPGTLNFTCGMNMMKGSVVVVQ